MTNDIGIDRRKVVEVLREKRKTRTKLYDLGHKLDSIGESPVMEKKVYYPSFTVTEKELPGIKQYGMDKTITLKIVVKVKGIYQRDEKPKDYTLEIQKAGFIK